jgi:large subunit ribosomal protein L15
MSFNQHALTGGNKSKMRKGRGPGSKGKTSGRGHKGAASRSGYKTRPYYEGGNITAYERQPKRGFTRGRFKNNDVRSTLCLSRIDSHYNDGDILDLQSAIDKNLVKSTTNIIKLIGNTAVNTKLSEVVTNDISQGAKNILESHNIKITITL